MTDKLKFTLFMLAFFLGTYALTTVSPTAVLVIFSFIAGSAVTDWAFKGG